tara:strand:- start:339 stop:473 length:135 start_codon:yes stop_codon:yes gene_type:complete
MTEVILYGSKKKVSNSTVLKRISEVEWKIDNLTRKLHRVLNEIS